MDSTDYNTSCNCEMRLDVDGDGADVGDDLDNDLDDARDDDDDDGDDLPFREVISPAESPRRRWLFSSVRFPHRGGGVSRKQLLFRGFHPRGGLIGEGGHREGPPGRGVAPGTLLAAWWFPPPSPSAVPSHLA